MFLNIRDRYWFLSSEMGFFSFLEAVKKSCLSLFDMMYVMPFQINNVVFSLSNLMFFLILRKSCVLKSIKCMKTFGQKKWLILRKSISRIKWSHTLIFFTFDYIHRFYHLWGIVQVPLKVKDIDELVSLTGSVLNPS